jgi:hypothetical protein
LSVATYLAGSAACSLLAPEATCGGTREVQRLSQTLIESGSVGGVVLAASYGNSQVKAGLGLLASAVGIGGNALEAAAGTLKSIVKAGPAALDVQAIVTKETKSRGSVVCSADVHLNATPPPGVMGTGMWTLASESHWPVVYTAEITADAKDVSVILLTTTCAGPGCKVSADLEETARQLQGSVGDELLQGKPGARKSGTPGTGDQVK